MQTTTEFRLLLTFNLLLIPVAMFVASYDDRLLPSPLQTYLLASALQPATLLEAVSSIVGMLGFFGILVGLAGMYGFWRWARRLTFWSTIVIYVPALFSGPAIISGPAYLLESTAAILWGALLAAAYWAPVSSQFERRGARNGAAPPAESARGEPPQVPGHRQPGTEPAEQRGEA